MKIEIIRIGDDLIILDGCGEVIGTAHWLYNNNREDALDMMPKDVQIAISRALRYID